MESNNSKPTSNSPAKPKDSAKDNFGKADLKDQDYGDSYKKTIDSDPNSSKLRSDQDAKDNKQLDKNKSK
ncbi:MAG: hypothetical protein H7333_05090 [Bdellovibrionales bacterium]|nr:hypothetical protein [Oligoflexia bacterium]